MSHKDVDEDCSTSAASKNSATNASMSRSETALSRGASGAGLTASVINPNYRLCLVMIVKNEEDVIKDCLESVAPWISYYVISDTGSTDKTKEIITSFFESKDIEGRIFDDSWFNFGENRSILLQHARDVVGGSCDYFLTMDADDVFVGSLAIPFTPFLPSLGSTSTAAGGTKSLALASAPIFRSYGPEGFKLMLKFSNSEYDRVCLFRADLPWRYEGVLHENPLLDFDLDPSAHQRCLPFRHSPLITTGHIKVSSSGGSRSKGMTSAEKYARDSLILLKEVGRDPTNPRSVFYLAQSYRDALNHKEAIRWYLHRAKMPNGWYQEVYFSWYQAGLLSTKKEDKIKFFNKAIEIIPRLEAITKLMALYREDGDNLVESFKVGIKALPHHIEKSNSHLFLVTSIYDYEYFDEMSLASYYMGLKGLAKDMFKRIKNVPKHAEDRIRKNRKFLT